MEIHQFKPGDIIADRYSNNHYQVIEPDKNGMSKIRNLTTNSVETWNAYNNKRFHRLEGQLVLFGNK